MSTQQLSVETEWMKFRISHRLSLWLKMSDFVSLAVVFAQAFAHAMTGDLVKGTDGFVVAIVLCIMELNQSDNGHCRLFFETVTRSFLFSL
jgi:hypothetical protein